MNKTHCMLITLLSFFSQIAVAKETPITWGEVDQRDIELSTWKEDPEASAVILCDYGTLTIGPRTVYTRHFRIKILKEEGLKYATVELPYRALNQYESFTELKAQTLQADPDGKIRKIKVKATSDKPIDRRHNARTFTFPEAKVGSILEYRYTLVSLDFVKPEDWAFRHPVPCIWSEYKVNIPNDFYYLVTLQNKPGLSIEQQKEFASSLEWLYSASRPYVLRETLNTKDILFSAKGQRTTYFLSGRSMRFVMQNQPSLVMDELGRPDEEEYPTVRTHLFLSYGYFPFWYKHLLLSADEDYEAWNTSGIRSRISRSLSYIQYYLPTWQEMNTYWMESERFGTRYRKDPEIPERLAKIAGKGDTEKETLRMLFETVQRAIDWNGEYSMYSEQTPEKIFREGKGTSGDINLLLWETLKAAGYQADPVLVKTTPGRPENLYPVRSQFNHVVIRITLNEETYYLDAIHKEKPFRYLDDIIHGSLGWVVSGNGGWVDVENINPQMQLHRFAFMK